MSFDEAATISEEIHATDVALELTSGGVPLRDAYRMAAAEPERRAGRTPDDSLRAGSRRVPARADPQFNVLDARLKALR